MFLKVKWAEKFYFVKIFKPESEEFNSNGIIVSILNKLNLKVEAKDLRFRDRDGAELDFDDLAEIIQQYRFSSSFFVELWLDGATSDNINIKKELEDFIKKGDSAAIFNEYAAKQTLTDCSRRRLVRESVNFLCRKSGNYPKREEKIAVAEAIIQLFPSYKVDNSNCGGIDLFYNPQANSGYLVAKLKNLNSKRRKLCTEETATKRQENDSSSEEENINEQDLHFFQNCLVSEQLLSIKERLKQTLKGRLKYCSADVNVLEAFPIFVLDFSLILLDFELRYGEIKANELNSNWLNYKHFVGEVANETGGPSADSLLDWPADIRPFLILLQLLPSTAAGRNTKRTTINTSVSTFITFEELHTPIKNYKVGSRQPTIIAVGENKSCISQYFISLEGKYISLPLDYDFPQIFDVYFKSFYVFNVEFDITLANFLRFFAKFLYGIDTKKTPSTRLIEVYSKFQKKFKTLE